MRQMFDFVSLVGEQASKAIKECIETKGEDTFEFKTLARKFTVDVIASCAFGIEVNSFQNENNDFIRLACNAVNFDAPVTMLKFIGFMVNFLKKNYNEIFDPPSIGR